MENCLVTTLLDTVSGDDFLYLDKLVFSIDPSEDRIVFSVSGPNLTVDLIGNGELQYSNGNPVASLPHALPSDYLQEIYIVTNGEKVKYVINNGYNITTATIGSGKISNFKYCFNMTSFTILNNSVGYFGSIDTLKNLTNLQTISFENVSGVDGNVESLINLHDLNKLNLRYSNVKGSLNVLADGLAQYKNNGDTLRVLCNAKVTINNTTPQNNVYKYFTFDGEGGWTVSDTNPSNT